MRIVFIMSLLAQNQKCQDTKWGAEGGP